jgi:hypothetical protein
MLGYLAGTPFTVLAWPEFRADFQVQQRFSREGWEGQGAAPVAWLYAEALGNGLGWIALGLAAVGLGLMTWRRPVAAIVLGGFPLAYLLFMLGVKLFFVRFATPMAPFLCLAGGYAIAELARLAPAGLARTAAVGVLAGATLLQPLRSDLQHLAIMRQPDTRVQAFEWLRANVAPGARIVAEEYSVRDRRPRGDLPDRALYDLDLPDSGALGERDLAGWRQAGYRYAVISSFQYRRFPGRFGTYAALDGEARLLASFAPTAHASEPAFDIEALYSPFHDLGELERPGPTVKIYDLSPR